MDSNVVEGMSAHYVGYEVKLDDSQCAKHARSRDWAK